MEPRSTLFESLTIDQDSPEDLIDFDSAKPYEQRNGAQCKAIGFIRTSGKEPSKKIAKRLAEQGVKIGERCGSKSSKNGKYAVSKTFALIEMSEVERATFALWILEFPSNCRTKAEREKRDLLSKALFSECDFSSPIQTPEKQLYWFLKSIF